MAPRVALERQADRANRDERVESACGEGGIDAKERGILDRLRGKLGLHADDARAVERDVAERFAPS